MEWQGGRDDSVDWVDGVVRMVGVVRVITGQGGQFGQVVGMLGSSSQHNVISENKWVYMCLSSSIKENMRLYACDRLGSQVGWRITSARIIDIDLTILLAAVVDMLWRQRRCLPVY